MTLALKSNFVRQTLKLEKQIEHTHVTKNFNAGMQIRNYSKFLSQFGWDFDKKFFRAKSKEKPSLFKIMGEIKES